MKNNQPTKRVINAMIRNLKDLKGEEKSSFVSEVVLNLALYGGKDSIDGLEEVEAAMCDVKDIVWTQENKRKESKAA